MLNPIFYRIQSFYLFISIVLSNISLYLYLQKKNPFFLKKILLIFLIICLFLSICSFLSFKKRKLQIFLNSFNILLNSIIFILKIIFFSYYPSFFLIKMNFFILLSILFLYLSNKSIKKDLELIYSMNRI
ncbi:DUF4293 family protein [Blattabacterium cuenoti]|uniref:DUF4293 family protein n=1 Tax=Blattabacterium cuenoti TaxID=1653831 RepID=UPI001EEA6EB3|nr:DUF4293 family protein [Blattabacterium cuenoti]